MPGASDFLFGSAPSTKFTVKPTVTPEQAASYSKLLEELGGAGGGGQAYGGALGAPLSSLETTSLAGLEQMAMQPNPLYEQGNQALSGILSGGPADFDEYFSKTVQEPLMREFEENILPGISRRFAPSGFYSSDRTRSDDLARRDLTEGLGRARADVGYQAFQADKQNKLAALGLLPSVAGARGDELTRFLEAGATPREAEAMNNQLKYEEFVRQQSQREDRLKALIAALGLPQFENIAVQKGGSTGALGSLAQGAGAFLGGYFGG